MVGGLWLFWTAALKKVSVPLSSLAPSKNTKTNTNTIHIQNIQQVKYRDTKTRQKAKDKQDSYNHIFFLNSLSCAKPTLGWLSKVCATLRHDCASFCCVSSPPQAIETLHGPCQLQTLPPPCIFCISTCICQTWLCSFAANWPHWSLPTIKGSHGACQVHRTAQSTQKLATVQAYLVLP